MNNIDDKILEIKEELFNDEIVKQYLKTKEAIKTDPTLVQIQKDIAYLTHTKQLKEAKYLKEQFDNHPLCKNFKVLTEEVVALLNEIKDNLQE